MPGMREGSSRSFRGRKATTKKPRKNIRIIARNGVECLESSHRKLISFRGLAPGPAQDLPLSRRCQTEFIDDWFALCAYLSQCRFYLPRTRGKMGSIIALACI